MRAGNALSELSNNKPNSNSINKTINTRNNKTSSHRQAVDKEHFYKPNYKPPRIVGTEGFTSLGHS